MLYNLERPHTFDYMVGQEHIVENISNQSKDDKWFQVYILAGQFGSGKTTIARIIALAANCKHKDANGNPCLVCESCKSILEGNTTDIIEIDGASSTGIDNIRELKENIIYSPINLSKKVYIIDEVHMLSKGAFNALLKVLEEPPKHAMFILCTTELKSIPATVRSRAGGYTFEQIPYDTMYKRLHEISIKYEMDISDDALALIVKNAQGAMRNAYTLLEQVTSGSNKRVEASDVQRVLGITDITYLFALLKNIINAKPAECISIVEQAASMGKDWSLMINDLLDIVTDAVTAKSTSLNNIHDTQQYKELLSEIVNMSYVEQLCQIADGLMNIRIDLRKCFVKSTIIVGIIRITTSTISTSVLSRLDMLEKAVQNGSLITNNLNENVVGLEENKCIDEKTVQVQYKEDTSDKVDETEQPADGPAEMDSSMAAELSENSSDEVNSKSIETNENDKDDFAQMNNDGFEQIGDSPFETACATSEQSNNMDGCQTETELPSKEEVQNEESSIKEEKPWNENDGGHAVNHEAADVMKTEPAKEQSIDDPFDMFSYLEEFNSFSSMTNAKSVSDQSSNQKNVTSPSKQTILEEHLKLISNDDQIFSTALLGCKKSMENDFLVLKTPLKPVFDIIQTYLRVSDVQEITVVFDPGISLN